MLLLVCCQGRHVVLHNLFWQSFWIYGGRYYAFEICGGTAFEVPVLGTDEAEARFGFNDRRRGWMTRVHNEAKVQA